MAAYKPHGLQVGSRVEVGIKKNSPPRSGVIRWIGIIPQMHDRMVAGVELDKEEARSSNGKCFGVRYFTCPQGRGLFTLLENCRQINSGVKFKKPKNDRRFQAERSRGREVGRANSFDTAGIIMAAGESSQTDTAAFIEQQRQILAGLNSPKEFDHSSNHTSRRPVTVDEERKVHREKDPKDDSQRQLRELEQQLSNVQLRLQEKEAREVNLHRQLREKNQRDDNSQRQLREMQQQVTRMEQQLREKEGELENSERVSRERNQQLTQCQVQLRAKELQEAGLHEQLRGNSQQQENSQRHLREMEQQLREKDRELENSVRASREREQELTHCKGQLREKELQEASLRDQLREKRQQVIYLLRELREKGELEENLQRQLREMEQQLAEKNEQEENLQTQLRRQLSEFRVTEQEKDNLQQQLSTLERQQRAKDQEVSELETTLTTARRALSERQRQQSPDWVIPRDQIQLMTENVLGRGAWGNVVEGKYCGCAVAVKQIHELILSPHNRNLFEREMNIASRCRHPCLLQFIGATNDEGSRLFVTELMESSLRALLEQRSLSAAEVSSISLDVAQALSYLHHKTPPIIHRDISSANVLLWRQGDQWRGKVSDYGTANFLQRTMTVAPGAMVYIAPEALTSNQTVKIDVYSFGVLLCEMCIRELPDPERRDEQIAMVVSRQLRAVIRRCVQTDPETRPSMEEIIEELV